MPYLPNGATPAQLEAFAMRVAQQLGPSVSRKSLMSVREAFARSAGYPNAHAMEVDARKDAFWNKPLVALGKFDINMRLANLPLTGLRPAKLAKWASQAWKQYRPLLASEPFTPEHARALLALLWNHASWPAALAAANEAPRFRKYRMEGLVFSADLDELDTFSSSYGGNMGGIHRVLGKSDDGQWVGLSCSGAMMHTRIVGEAGAQRYALTCDWVSHRILQGDRLMLVDASEDGSVGRASVAAAHQMGLEPCVVDLSKGQYLSNLHQMSAGGLAALLLAMLDYPVEQSDHIISWVSKVALRWKAGHEFNEPTDPGTLLRGLENPEQHMDWWRRDVGLSQALNISTKHAREAFAHTPADWKERLAAVTNLWKSCVVDTSSGGNRLFGPLTIFRLPFLLDKQDRATTRRMVAMATLPWRDQISQGLGETLEGSQTQNMEIRPAPLERIPMVCCHVDIPAHAYARGEAIVSAQSRASGVANLFVGPRSAWGENMDREWLLANTNTGIYLDTLPGDEYPDVEFRAGQHIVIHRKKKFLVWPTNQDRKPE